MKKLFTILFLLSAFIANAQRTMFGGQNNYMAPVAPPVTTVTTGLILFLDATRSASYGGTGTIWNDISGQSPAGSATLVGNPPFASGSFTFGPNMNASTTKTYTVSNQLTLIAWVNPSQTQSTFTGVIFRRTSYDGGVLVCLYQVIIYTMIGTTNIGAGDPI